MLGGVSTGNDFIDEQCCTMMGKVTEDIDNDGNGDEPLAVVTVEMRLVLDNGTQSYGT